MAEAQEAHSVPGTARAKDFSLTWDDLSAHEAFQRALRLRDVDRASAFLDANPRAAVPESGDGRTLAAGLREAIVKLPESETGFLRRLTQVCLEICADILPDGVYTAVSQNKPYFLEAMLLEGAPPDPIDARGNHPLNIAIQEGNRECFDLLLAYGAASGKASGRHLPAAPIEVAIKHNRSPYIEALVAAGAALGQPLSNGTLLLDWAIAKGKDSAAATLERLGAPGTPAVVTAWKQRAPHAFLEDYEGLPAQRWIARQNRATGRWLGAHPGRLKATAAHERRLWRAGRSWGGATLVGGDHIVSTVLHDERRRGVISVASWRALCAGREQWRPVFDLREMDRRYPLKDGRPWLLSQISAIKDGRCLVLLSQGGEDAVAAEEIDLEAGGLVADGFSTRGRPLLSCADEIIWVSKDIVICKLRYSWVEWRRGESVQEGEPLVGFAPGSDFSFADTGHRAKVRVSVLPMGKLYVDPCAFGRGLLSGIERWQHLDNILSGIEPLLVDNGVLYALVTTTAARGEYIRPGDLFAMDLGVLEHRGGEPPEAGEIWDRIYATGANESIRSIRADGGGGIWLHLLRDCEAVLLHVRCDFDGWETAEADLPQRGSYYDMGTPGEGRPRPARFTSITHGHSIVEVCAPDTLRTVRQFPPYLGDCENIVQERIECLARDGARIPCTFRAAGTSAGPRPTLLYVYGGYGACSSLDEPQAEYSAWLRKGGACAIAHVRGGGEFGPGWATAGKGDRSWRDLVDVADHLVARGWAARGIVVEGGSYGAWVSACGILEAPDLFAAGILRVGAMDVNNEGIHGTAGASSGVFSPYADCRTGAKPPPVLIVTSSTDTRVGPAHSRKLAARFSDLGGRVLYREFPYGGHALSGLHDMRKEVCLLTHCFLDDALKAIRDGDWPSR